MTGSDRYSRQKVLGRLGEAGQRKLADSKVTVVGLGALGTVIAELLARAGVGRLRLIDRDVVELVNLQRQLLYDEGDIGHPKAVRAAAKLRAINSTIEVEGLAKDVNYSNVLDLVRGSDLIMDGTDNFETRFLLNEASSELGIPWIYGGAIEVEGRVMTIVPGKTACFRCFNRHIPAPGQLPTCETSGILNSVSTAVASLQVTEAVRLLTGEDPSGRLLVLDGWSPELLSFRMERRSDCPVCVMGEMEILKGGKRQVVSSLCGQNSLSFDPLRKNDIDLKALVKRLEKVGRVKVTGSIVFFEVERYQMTIFQDGRAIIKGTESEEVAKSLYSKFIGL